MQLADKHEFLLTAANQSALQCYKGNIQDEESELSHDVTFHFCCYVPVYLCYSCCMFT